MRGELQDVLDLQPSWVAKAPSEDMQLRGLYVRNDLAEFVRDRADAIAARLLCAPEDVEIEGKDATGSFSRVPWVRFADRERSANPREGWYVVYLFAENGSEVALSLNQGTQVWDGVGLRSQPEASILRRSEWARTALGSAIGGDRLSRSIALGSGDKSRAYQAGNVVAYRYASGSIPPDTVLESDLLRMAELLQLVYGAESRAPAPGEPAPEILDAEEATQALAGRKVPKRTGFRPSVPQRRAIELRAMRMAVEYYNGLGATVRDTSATSPFDLEVRLASGQRLTVEVKGTAGDGAEILLTRGEVEHHRSAHPDNALAIVSGIVLGGPPEAPEASGGTLLVTCPWAFDDDDLTPLSYRYAVGRNG